VESRVDPRKRSVTFLDHAFYSHKNVKTMKNADLLQQKMQSAQSRVEKLIGKASTKLMVKNALAKECSRKDSGNRETGILDCVQDARLLLRKSNHLSDCSQECSEKTA